MNSVLTSKEKPVLSQLGGKGYALAKLTQAGFQVPEWFVISPEFSGVDALSPQTLETYQFSDTQQTNIRNALASLNSTTTRYAVRSSALDEDGQLASFAGQLDSYLNVSPEDVPARIIDVWRSANSERTSTYRKEHGLSEYAQLPAVLVQRMVEADCSGVAFSTDIETGHWASVVINAVNGLGEKLVSGEVDSESWKVARDNTLQEHVPLKDKQTVLSQEQAKEVATLARKCEHFFGRPQDIEWSYQNGTLYLLQSRPITTLHLLPDPDGALNIWDNSNIAESYGGVTTPLTFSFAHYIYKEVYQQFCMVMHVPLKTIEEHRAIFNTMLGLIRGRVYYNLMSWYRMLALLPGFSFNRKFMEQMMGVKEGLPEAVLKEFEHKRLGARLRDGMRLGWAILGLVKAQITLPRMIAKFYKHFDATLKNIEAPLEAMRAEQLAAHFHQLEQQLLSRWNAPLVNDFFAMIYFGVLRSLTQKWCQDEDGTLQNGLLCGTGNIISAEPARRIREMAEIAAHHPKITEALLAAEAAEAIKQLSTHGELYQLYNNYLDRFADRCLNELKLESPTLRDNPEPLLRSIGSMAKRLGNSTQQATQSERHIQQDAENKGSEILQGHIFKHLIFRYVLKQARNRVRDRENLRFERTRLFGRIRQIFVEIGRRLHAMNQLDQARDIFYLTIDEALGYIEGTTTTTKLKGLVELRKNEFNEHKQSAPPSDRFETYGAVNVANDFAGKPRTNDSSGANADLKGIGCCPGIVKGKARVVRDPKDIQMQPGEILVAEQTDPGWITLFPASSGVLVQRGSLLSHTAIVSREMGIPAIVSITGLLDTITTGDLIEFDGKTGIIRLLKDNA